MLPNSRGGARNIGKDQEKQYYTKRSIDKLILEQVDIPSSICRSLQTGFVRDGIQRVRNQSFSQGAV